MNHQMIAHRWAQRDSKGHAKGYAMFFDGFSIFSHGRHFEIARWVETKCSEKVRVEQGVPAMCVLFNSRKYSVSTSKHQSYTRWAIPSNVWVFELPSDIWGDHVAALRYFETEALKAYEKATRARVYAESHRSEAERILNEAQNFALAFAVKWKRPDMTELRAKADKAVKKAATEKRKAEKAAIERNRLQRIEDAATFQEWLEGKVHFVPNSYHYTSNQTAYVRRYGDELQTSQGASVPWEHALKAFRFIKLCRERGEGWNRNGKTVRVGHFQIDSIDAQGNMRAGCHAFSWDDMRALAERENVAGFEASDAALEPKS